jgi:membrane protease YdiL (CAAX protease family)
VRRLRRAARLALHVLRAAWLLFAWMFLLVFFTRLRSPWNAAWVLGVTALLLWWHALRPGIRRKPRERATLRLRAPPAWSVPLLARAALPLVAANLASLLLAVGTGLGMGGDDHKMVHAVQRQGVFGVAALQLWMLVFAPVLEEFVCRGWLQRPLERRLGPAPAIGIAAAVFAALHLQPAGFANRFILGAFSGYAVYATGSIWAGVALHASNNVLAAALAALGSLSHGAKTAGPAHPAAFHPGLVGNLLLVLALAACLRTLLQIGREMWTERRRQREACAQAATAAAAERRALRAADESNSGQDEMSDTIQTTEAPTTAPASLRALLEGIVDYAGLFPPAKLSMADAVARYAEARTGDAAWMLGRFVVPAGRLAEFAAEAEPYFSRATDGEPWRVSALAGPEMAADFASVDAFNRAHAGTAVVDSVEVKAASAEGIIAAARLLPDGTAAYFEVAADTDSTELLDAVKRAGARAKIRTGGVTEDAFPAPADVLHFLAACAAADLPLKATAGLHHPLRAEHPLTYETDAPLGTMFGFLNVFLAAAFLRGGVDAAQVAPLLEERDPAALRFGGEGVEWRGLRLSTEQIRDARRGFAASFGSCSFSEPVCDLKALGLL